MSPVFLVAALIDALTLPKRMTRGSPGCSRHPFEADEATHVVGEVSHSDLAPRANDADGAHDLGSHAVLLITEYMLDAGAHLRSIGP